VSEIPDDPGLGALRRAVARVHYLNNPLIWQTLGLPLADELAKVEGSWLTDSPIAVSSSARYIAENIDAAIHDFALIQGMAGR
jgi:hypothetical protein